MSSLSPVKFATFVSVQLARMEEHYAYKVKYDLFDLTISGVLLA